MHRMLAAFASLFLSIGFTYPAQADGIANFAGELAQDIFPENQYKEFQVEWFSPNRGLAHSVSLLGDSIVEIDLIHDDAGKTFAVSARETGWLHPYRFHVEMSDRIPFSDRTCSICEIERGLELGIQTPSSISPVMWLQATFPADHTARWYFDRNHDGEWAAGDDTFIWFVDPVSLCVVSEDISDEQSCDNSRLVWSSRGTIVDGIRNERLTVPISTLTTDFSIGFTMRSVVFDAGGRVVAEDGWYSFRYGDEGTLAD